MYKKIFKKAIMMAGLMVMIILLLHAARLYDAIAGKDVYNTYRIDAVFDDMSMQLACTQTFEYTNTEKEALAELYFHLYPNAFKRQDQVPIAAEEFTIAYPKGFSAGYIDIKEIKVNGEAVSYTIQKSMETILNIELPHKLKPHRSADIFIRYVVRLPRCQNRFGYGDNSVNVTHWYPILSVYDENGWNLDPYYPIGDPFYSDVSDYRVSITLPEQYVIAHTGKLEDRIIEGDHIRYVIRADKVRDFAWFISPCYEVIENRVGDTNLKSYHYSANGIKALEIATKALITFNELYGQYPYENLSIVESDFYVGGMEYPQIVQIDSSTYQFSNTDANRVFNSCMNNSNTEGSFSYNEDALWLEYLIVHEIAHQWWYGIVGNNQVKEPWLDEALTEYSTILYFEKNEGKEKRNAIWDIFIRSNIERYKPKHNMPDTANRPINDFESWREYSATVYSQGALVHHELRQMMGDAGYFTLLRKYYERYQYENAKIKDFMALASEVAKKDLENFFAKRLRVWYK